MPNTFKNSCGMTF